MNTKEHAINQVKVLPKVYITEGKEVAPPRIYYDKDIIVLKKKTLEAYYDIFDKDKSFWQRAGAFITGTSRAGRISGILKDAALAFLPWGPQVNELTDFVTKVIQPEPNPKPMKDFLKRAFTTDGGSLVRLRDEDGNWSMTAIGASIVRLLLILGLVWAGEQLGIPVVDTVIGIFSQG